MDWSDAIPYKSLDPFDRRACLATYQYMLGVHTRKLAVKLRNDAKIQDQRFVKLLPMFTAPLYADLMDSMAAFVSFFATIAKGLLHIHIYERVNNFVYDLAETLVRANGSIIHENIETSRTAIHQMMILQGGFNVPDEWFNVDDTKLKQLMDRWMDVFRVTMGDESEFITRLDPS